jgi:hypothetical protein
MSPRSMLVASVYDLGQASALVLINNDYTGGEGRIL